MKKLNRKYLEWTVTGMGFVALFLFFFRLLPYHLFHREQTQLFLFAYDALAGYWKHPAGVAQLCGDFLTQFFYYKGAGPAVLAAVLVLWGWVVFRLLVPYIGRWAWIPAVAAVVWETGRQCGLSYPLSGTVSLIGIGGVLLLCRCLICRSRKVGISVAVVALAVGCWAFGPGDWSASCEKPNYKREHLLALDIEVYRKNWEKAGEILGKTDFYTPVISYYYNLLNAHHKRLPDRLLEYYQPASQGLFLPWGSTLNYFLIYASNELWFALGDMTMAEHATIVGMIFSPRHTGARAMKRMAEINLVNGDDVAAMKYLRMLRKTMCYRDWAEQRIPGRQTPEVRQWLEQKRRLLAKTDVVRSSVDVASALRCLLRSNSDNGMARDYLFCYDLLNKDIRSFANDYQEFASGQALSGLYAEGAMVHLAKSKASMEDVKRWQIPPQTLARFNEYSKTREAHQRNGASLQAKFGRTYWFYYHYATMKGDNRK